MFSPFLSLLSQSPLFILPPPLLYCSFGSLLFSFLSFITVMFVLVLVGSRNIPSGEEIISQPKGFHLSFSSLLSLLFFFYLEGNPSFFYSSSFILPT